MTQDESENPYFTRYKRNQEIRNQRLSNVTVNVVDVMRERLPADVFAEIHARAKSAVRLRRRPDESRTQFRAFYGRIMCKEMDDYYKKSSPNSKYQDILHEAKNRAFDKRRKLYAKANR